VEDCLLWSGSPCLAKKESSLRIKQDRRYEGGPQLQADGRGKKKGVFEREDGPKVEKSGSPSGVSRGGETWI